MVTPKQLFSTLNPPSRQAYDVVAQLTDEQCRYALWACLVATFGDPECNANPRLASKCGLPTYGPMLEGVAILADIAIKKTVPRAAIAAEEAAKLYQRTVP